MFVADYDVEEVKGEVSKMLKKWGIKYRFKKFDTKTVEKKEVVGVFKTHLEKLSQEKTKLMQYDQLINIPAFVLEACNYLRSRMDTEGIFRKSGGVARQKELKQKLVNGGRLGNSDYKAIDVADLLKLFFRELPEPCIPYMFHDTLQRCLDNTERHKEAVFLTLLMLPSVYLYTLAYLMQFLQEVAAHCQYNQMDASNLAIVWTPNLMPFKTGRVDDKQALEKRLAIIQMLIEDASQIGVVPECLYDHLPSWQPSASLSSHDELEHSRHRYKKKKRRSGSLTRMLSGIKKMVKGKVAEEVEVTTPENSVSVSHTPRIMSTGKKRKASESNLTAFSAKKRKDLLESLPHGAVLPDICTTTHLTPRVLLPQPLTRNFMGSEVEPKRRSRFYTYKSEGPPIHITIGPLYSPSRPADRYVYGVDVRPPRTTDGNADWEEKKKSSRSLSSSRLRLSNFGFSKKHHKRAAKMEDSGFELTATPDTHDLTTSSEDYVRISRSEYEDIKNRVSKIESRISSEFENIVGVSMSDLELTPDRSPTKSVKTVQTAYEKTLESAEKFNSPTSDELARRFSKELKIRGSSGKKVIRSPSARKIGTIRRRSRDKAPKIKRNLSLNINDRISSSHPFYPNGLRRGKPNTPSNGLPNPLMVSTDKSQENFRDQLKSQAFENQRESFSGSFDHVNFDITSFGVLTRSQTRRASSFHGCDLKKVPTSASSSGTIHNSNIYTDSMVWKSAETFLNEEEKTEEKPTTGRPSLAKIRSQNAGMVLAKAKMFNTMIYSDNDSNIPRSTNCKCQGIKKRNSSKSSKERRLQRKKSGNQKNEANQEAPVESIEISSSLSVKAEGLSCRNNNAKTNSKENHQKHPMKETLSSLPKTPLHSKKAPAEHQYSVNKVKTTHSHVYSPLRERNMINSPRGSGARIPAKKCTPKVSRPPPSEVRAALVKSVSSTPRRSPRQLSYKSKYGTKQLG